MIAWFQTHGRKLPWRNHPTPYQVWVSELMLQQTQVVTVIPYYERWMNTFPDIHALSQAPLQQVLSLWAGLGYYRRAKYLHEGARIIVSDYDGVFPSTISELRKIPGIGDYTAGAIASFAFNQNEPAIDGNAERVLSRFFGIAGDLSHGEPRKNLVQIAQRLANLGHSRELNQAIMDLGASYCSKKACCDKCPIADKCYALSQGLTETLPQKKNPIQKIYELRTCIKLLNTNKKILIAKRKADALLGNLWEFPMISLFKGTAETARDQMDIIKRRPRKDLWNHWLSQTGSRLLHCDPIHAEVHHTFTHIQMTVIMDTGELSKTIDLSILPHEDYDEYAWIVQNELDNYPMSTLMKKVLRFV